MTAQASDDVKESEEEIERLKKAIDQLEEEMKEALDDLEEKWNDIASRTTEIQVTPYKKDAVVELFGVAWVPYHLVDAGGHQRMLAGYALPESA